jgi:hypothetical protein
LMTPSVIVASVFVPFGVQTALLSTLNAWKFVKLPDPLPQIVARR